MGPLQETPEEWDDAHEDAVPGHRLDRGLRHHQASVQQERGDGQAQ